MQSYPEYKKLKDHSYKILFFSHTRSGLPFFYPYQPVGKIKNKQPKAGRTLIGDAIVLLEIGHHVASQHISGNVFHVFQYKMRCLVVRKKKNPLYV